MTRILISGGAGFRNSGDEALQRSCVQVIRDFAPTAELMLLANGPAVARNTLKGLDVALVPSPRYAFFHNDHHYGPADDVFRDRWARLHAALVGRSAQEARAALENAPELDFIDRADALAFWDALCSADALVVHGGGILTSATRSRLWEQALTVEAAAGLGKRVLLRSHQMGPFTTDEDRAHMRTILRCAAFATTRDARQSSIEVEPLQSATIAREEVDDALILRLDEDEPALLARHGLTAGNYICLGYRENPGVGVSAQAFDRTVEIARSAYATFGLIIALLPQGPFDIPVLERIAAALDVPAQVVRPFDAFRDPLVIAANARLMIACPHHSLIFALRGAVPILSPSSGAYYLFKNRGSMRFFGLEDQVFDIDAADYLTIAEDRLARIRDGGDALRTDLAYRVAELRLQSARTNLKFGRLLTG